MSLPIDDAPIRLNAIQIVMFLSILHTGAQTHTLSLSLSLEKFF
jgi:hypothetical protein